MKVLTRFLLSATTVEQFPAPGPPEIAFLGRSNVGKSSLLNSLLGAKVARTSSTPGRTRAINFFDIRFPGKPRPDFVFADFPGYGYAKISREISAEWPKFIEPYLEKRASLALCVVLVDPNIPTQGSDRQLVEWLHHAQRRFAVVTTKSDKLSSHQLSAALDRLSEELGGPRILPFSARTGMGRDELWREIRAAAHGETND